MRTLPKLLASADGRAFLESRGVFATEEAFVGRLQPPGRNDLRELAGLDPKAFAVYSAHQVKSDYALSVISKIRAAWGLDSRHSSVGSVLLWLDMDRAGSDKRTTGMNLRGRGGTLQVRFASRRHDDKEVRFAPIERQRLDETLRRLGAWARQHGARAAERYAGLVEAVLSENPATLAEVNMALTSFLLREHLGVEASAILISDLAGQGLLTEAIDDTVDRIDDVVTVFNAAIDSLAAADVDPQVRPLGPDYLPLHYSCDRDGRRCALIHERQGTDHYAVTTCLCEAVYRFHLGSGSLSIGELAETGRWSTDVTLPMYLNDLASGVVAGQSSALYGLVLNEVMEKVLARRAIPMLVPKDLSTVLTSPSGAQGVARSTPSATAEAGSLLAEYLVSP
jgi:hypothetical protein